MPVGFTSLPPMDSDNVPDAPWALEFSRFVGPGGTGGAHNATPMGGAARGFNITVAHTDTGYVAHPELLQNGTVRQDARTFTDPFPSMLSIADIGGVASNFSVIFGASVSINNGIQVSAGASISLTYPDDGIDPLIGFSKCHGTSTGSLIMSPQGMPGGAYQANATAFMASSVAPEYIRGRAPVAITGAAPEAMLLPLRVSDSVAIDPIVANNLTTAIRYAASLAKVDRADGMAVDPTLGVISISMGWPLAGDPLDFRPMATAIQAASDAGIVICAAAAQLVPYLNKTMEMYADFMDGINDAAGTVGDAADDVSDLATKTAIIARLSGLVLSNQPTLADLAEEIRQKALAANKNSDDIARYMALLRELTESNADTVRWIGGPSYPGTDPNTICCAACDINGFEMNDGFYGHQVDITAPGVNVYSARASLGNSGNDYYTHYSKGTSYATAITAGACALWQAHHGRDYLLTTYGAPMMVHLFRWALKHSSEQTTPQMTAEGMAWDGERRGYGILNAEALLAQSLPNDVETLMMHLRNENMITTIQEYELWDKLERWDMLETIVST